MKTRLLSWLILFCGVLHAQDQELDSLLRVLGHNDQDTNRVNTLLKVAWTIRNDDPAQAMEYSTEALELSAKLRFEKGQAVAYSTIGVLQYRGGDLPAAVNSHMNALKWREKIGDQNGVARSCINLGNVYSDMGDTARSLEYYFKSLAILEQGSDQERLAIVCLDIGGIYLAQNRNNQAQGFCARTLAIARDIGDPLLEAQAFNNMGVCYEHLDMPDSAMWAYKQSYTLAENLGDKVMMVDAMINVGNIYRIKGDAASAISWHNNGIEAAMAIGYLEGLRELYQRLSDDYVQQGDYKKAYAAYVKFKAYADSIYNENNVDRIATLTAKLESEQKELELKRMELEMEEQLRQQKMKSGFVIAGLIAVAVLIGLFVIITVVNKNRRRDRLVMEAQQQELNHWNPRRNQEYTQPPQ